MSEQSEAPKKIWLEYTPHEQHLYLTDELVWTGYLTEYVRADHYESLAEMLRQTARVLSNEVKAKYSESDLTQPGTLNDYRCEMLQVELVEEYLSKMDTGK